MIKCRKQDELEILEYIGTDFTKCAYLYIDLKKYGFENENINIWWQKNNSNNIKALALQYYNGMHIFSQDNLFDTSDIAGLIIERKPTLICGMKATLDLVYKQYLQGIYYSEYGHVVELKKHTGIKDENAYRAGREDLYEIAKLLAKDEKMGDPYGFELLYKQLLERYDEGFGRNWIKRDGQGIVSHVATYAELDNISVVSGGIVREDCRGKGEYSRQLGSMCQELLNSNFKIISYYYDKGRGAHVNVGFENIGEWEKLILKKDK